MGPEPYEDPSLQPGFVRTTKDFLKQSHLNDVNAKIKKEADEALK